LASALLCNANSNEEERSLAVSIYREAKAKALRAGAARKEMMELKMFSKTAREIKQIPSCFGRRQME